MSEKPDAPAGLASRLLALRRISTELREVLLSGGHQAAVARERINLIAARVRQIAGVFAVLTVSWIAVDAVSIPWPHWGELALGRVVASLGFAVLAFRRSAAWPTTSAVREIGLLVAIPLSFFFYANSVLSEGGGQGTLGASTAYYFLPFVVAAGLSIFPLTAAESWIYGGLCFVAMAVGIAIWPEFLSGQSSFSTLWRLALIAGIASLAGMSQLRFLLRLTEQAARDGLTGLLVRRVGEELLQSQFAYAERHDLPFSLVFIDLDHFKELNDRFGHDAGDAALRTAASNLRQMLRGQDIVIRWGGEEFMIALPATDTASAERAILRMAERGIGVRPDGRPLTASIGVAERRSDGTASLHSLAELADQRMYEAKRAGRNRYLLHDQPRRWLQTEE